MKPLLLALALLASSIPLHAQEQDLPELVDNALKAMNEGKWEEALALNAEAVKRFGGNPKNALDLHGPQFGVILFRKGISELKLDKNEDAIKSFESAYKDYPNDGKAAGGGNIFNKMALLKWGEAALGAGQDELAITQWKKFLQERDKTRDSYPQGAFHVNMAIAHYRLGKIKEGNEHLEIAINNKDTFPTPDAAIVSGFQSLVDAAIKSKDEQSITDFIAKNRGTLTLPPYAMQRFSKLFMKVGADAIAAEMYRTALSLYQFVPPTQKAIDDLRAVISDMGNISRISDRSTRLDRAFLETELAALESEQRGPKAMETIKLAAIAYIQEKAGNVRGAYAAYLQLENYFPQAENREQNLFHLIRTSSVIEDITGTRTFGEAFLKEYPDSKFANDVRKLMLSSLFYDGKYESSIDIASDIIDNKKVEEGTQAHDLALFVLGGSYFYTGQFAKAAPYLDAQVEKYPESVFAMPAAYFQASNVSRLQYWSKAASMLDAFLTKYKDNPDRTYIPLALYDRANTHYAEEQNELAVEKLDIVINEYPDSPVTALSYNLKGNVLQALDKNEEAESSYLKALELAEQRGDAGIAGEALYYLVALLGEQDKGDDPGSRLKDAVPYADQYWEKYSEGSPYRAQVAVAQVHALNSVGRGEEALERLQKVISSMAKLSEAPGLEEAINSYTDVYLEKYTPAQLKDHYYNFPGIDTQDKAARAILRIALIGVFEEVAKNEKEDAQKRSADAMIQVLFGNLKTDFDLKDLSNYILVKLGDYLRTNTATPREAIPYYDEALSRQDQSYRFAALAGRADVYGNSDSPADLDKALGDFDRIFADSQDKAEREFALYRTIGILMKKGDYAAVTERANQYLEREKGKSLGFSRYSPEVGLILARAFEARGSVDDAITMYLQVWSAYQGNIKISAPALLAWMELSYKRNNPGKDTNTPSDRQGAYLGGYRYLDLTGRFKDKMSAEEAALWDKVQALTDKYVADPNVKSVKQLKEEEEARR